MWNHAEVFAYIGGLIIFKKNCPANCLKFQNNLRHLFNKPVTLCKSATYVYTYEFEIVSIAFYQFSRKYLHPPNMMRSISYKN